MKPRKRRLLLSLLLIGAGMASAQTPAAGVSGDPQTSNTTLRIAGVVLNAKTGAPVAAARLYLVNVKQTRDVQTGLTSEDGHFAFQVERGKYSLEAAHKGFLRSAYNQHEQFSTAIVTGAGIDTDNLKFQLSPEAQISGKVFDESGEPVRNASVTLYTETHNSGISQIATAGVAQTDDLGEYELSSVRPGTYYLSAHASPWYALRGEANAAISVDGALDVAYPTLFYSDVTDSDEATPFPVRPGDQVSLDFHLYPVPALHLRIHVPTSGAASLPVFTQRVFNSPQPVRASFRSVPEPGVMEIDGLLPGRYTVQGPQDGGVGSGTEIEVHNDSEEIAPVPEDEAPAHLKVKVNLSGTTKTGARNFVLLGRQHRVTFAQELDDKGEAVFDSVPPNTYEVLIGSNSSAMAVIAIESNATRRAGHSLTVPPSGNLNVSITVVSSQAKVEGVAMKGGKPFAGAMIVLIPERPATHKELFRRDQSDLDGTFSLPGVIPGKYTLVAIEEGWDLDWAQPDVIAAYARHGTSITVNGDLEVRAPISVTPR